MKNPEFLFIFWLQSQFPNKGGDGEEPRGGFRSSKLFLTWVWPSPIPIGDSFGERAEGQKPVFVPIPALAGGGAELVPLPVS